MRHILVVDIETTPLPSAELALEPFVNMLRTRSKKDPLKVADELQEKRDKIQNKYALSPVTSRLICIGVLEIQKYEDGEDFAHKGDESTWHFFHGEESEQIKNFANLIKKNTEFVTYNGRGFDFPYLMYRATRHEVKLNLPIYIYNGKDNHFDISVHLRNISLLTNLDSSFEYTKLKQWAKVFGVGDKQSIGDDIDLNYLFEQGDFEKIEQYNKNDVVLTASIFEYLDGQVQTRWRRYE